uniref:Ovule protein n=1 Tax=Heterorhabditis bacteriophora TaxID=37862 RepID=A0A1I7W8P3_HETBA
MTPETCSAYIGTIFKRMRDVINSCFLRFVNCLVILKEAVSIFHHLIIPQPYPHTFHSFTIDDSS